MKSVALVVLYVVASSASLVGASYGAAGLAPYQDGIHAHWLMAGAVGLVLLALSGLLLSRLAGRARGRTPRLRGQAGSRL